jgi:hypothetical protein
MCPCFFMPACKTFHLTAPIAFLYIVRPWTGIPELYLVMQLQLFSSVLMSLCPLSGVVTPPQDVCIGRSGHLTPPLCLLFYLFKSDKKTISYR